MIPKPKNSAGTWFRRLLLIAIMARYTPCLQAQLIPTVRIETHFAVAQQAAPFDHSFYLILPVDTTVVLEDLYYLNMYKALPLHHGRKDTVAKSIKLYGPEFFQNSAFLDTPKEAGVKYLKVLIDTQLLPNSRFFVILSTRPSRDKFNDINESLELGDTAAARKAYKELSTGLTVKNSPIRVVWPKFETYQAKFDDTLRHIYDKIFIDDPTVVNSLRKLREILKPHVKVKDLFNCNCEGDFVARELFSDSTKFLIPLENLLYDGDLLNDFASGRLNMQEFEPYKQLKRGELTKRIDNLGKLKSGLANLNYFYHASSFAENLTDEQREIGRAHV